LFLLVDAALARANGFEDLALAIGLPVFPERFLALEFELADVGPEFLAKALHVLAQNRSELEFGGSASSGKPGGVGLIGVREEAVQLCQIFLGTRDLEIGRLQGERALAFDALTQPEYWGESKTERHDSGRERHEAIERILHPGNLLRRLHEEFA